MWLDHLFGGVRDHIGNEPLIARHAALGEQLQSIWIGFTLLLVSLVAFDAARPAPAGQVVEGGGPAPQPAGRRVRDRRHGVGRADRARRGQVGVG